MLPSSESSPTLKTLMPYDIWPKEIKSFPQLHLLLTNFDSILHPKVIALCEQFLLTSDILLKINIFKQLSTFDRKSTKELCAIKIDDDYLCFEINITENPLSFKHEINKEFHTLLSDYLYHNYRHLMHALIQFKPNCEILSNISWAEDKYSFPKINFIELMHYLGYPTDSDGMCYGFALMAVQAFCRNDFESYEERIRLINDIASNAGEGKSKNERIEYVVKIINETKQQMKDKDILSHFSTERILHMEKVFSIEAFFNGLVLYCGISYTDKDNLDLGKYRSQNYRDTAKLLSIKPDNDSASVIDNKSNSNIFGDIQVNSKNIAILSLNLITILIDKIINSEQIIAIRLTNNEHSVCLGGNKVSGCYFVDNEQCKRLFSPHDNNYLYDCISSIDNIVGIEEYGCKYSKSINLDFSENMFSQKTLTLGEKMKIIYISLKMNSLDSLNLILNTFYEVCDLGSMIDLLVKKGTTLFAIKCGNIEIIKTLFEYIIENKNISTVQKIKFINHDDGNNCCPLILTAMDHDRRKITSYLVTKIIEIDLFTQEQKFNLIEGKYNGITNIKNAISKKDVKLVRLFINVMFTTPIFNRNQKFKFIAPSGDDLTKPIFFASYIGNEEVVNIILKAIIECSDFSNEEKFNLVLSEYDDISSLYVANSKNHTKIVEILLQGICLSPLFPIEQKSKFIRSIGNSLSNQIASINKTSLTRQEKLSLLELLQ